MNAKNLPLDEFMITQMLDIEAPESIVEIVIRDDSKVIWINIDGLCRLRACQIKALAVDDRRTIDTTEKAEQARKCLNQYLRGQISFAEYIGWMAMYQNELDDDDYQQKGDK